MKDIKFQIESLQRSKIIMAVEAVAVNTSVMIGMYLIDTYLAEGNIIIVAGGVFGICYALYASYGNVQKHREIKELEKIIE